jgi:hypothetical protein
MNEPAADMNSPLGIGVWKKFPKNGTALTLRRKIRDK